MKKFKIIVFIAFFTCFIPTVKSERYINIGTNEKYGAKFKITGRHTETNTNTNCSNSDSRGGGQPSRGGDQDPGPGGGSRNQNCTTTTTNSTTSPSSDWTAYFEASHEFDLDSIGIDEGDTYTVNYEIESGGSGHCGSENMTRGADETTDYYTMQGTVNNASCGSGRR
tara:strand:- start:144 stop:647 length:504 start_codon:yes stop_codon:yes gene_type:complete